MESVFLPGLAPQKQDVGGLPAEELFPPNPLHIIAALRRTISIEVSRMARSWVPHPFRSLFAKRVGYLEPRLAPVSLVSLHLRGRKIKIPASLLLFPAALSCKHKQMSSL